MTIEEFRKQFKSIVYLKGLITSHRKHISSLHAYDKGGSHQNAIIRSLDKRDELKTKFDKMLNGKTYEQWLERSKKLSVLYSRLKRKKSGTEQIETQIIELLN